MRAIVIYGTRWGGTVNIAEKIGSVLTDEGYSVDVFDAKKNPQKVDQYDLFIIGSGIRADKWTREVLNFIEKNVNLLMSKKIALFVSCQMADGKKEAQDKAKEIYLERIASQYSLKPVSFGLFGGFLDFSKSHGLFVDILVRVNRNRLRKNGLDTKKVRDTRDWKIIEIWARQVAKTAFSK